MNFNNLIFSSSIHRAYDDDKYPTINFTAELNRQTVFSFSPESPGTKKQWSCLLEAYKKSVPYSIDWAPSNGECYIDFDGVNVEFCVNKRGDGCGGEICMSFPMKSWVTAFEMVAIELEDEDEDEDEED
jgi:hypothetical protein